MDIHKINIPNNALICHFKNNAIFSTVIIILVLLYKDASPIIWLYIITLCICIEAVIYYVWSKYVYLTIYKDGFSYRNFTGHHINTPWLNKITISHKKKKPFNGFEIVAEDNTAKAFIPEPVISSYQYKNAIRIYAPDNHPLKNMLYEQS